MLDAKEAAAYMRLPASERAVLRASLIADATLLIATLDQMIQLDRAGKGKSHTLGDAIPANVRPV